MAMFEQYSVSNAELSTAFQRAAQTGDKYLLVFEHTLGSDWMVTSAEYTRTIKDAAEIVPMLRDLNARLDRDDIHRLAAAYDLGKKFNEGATRDTSALPPQVLRDIEQYNKSYDLALRQKDWDKKSFIEKMFVTRPM